MMACKRQALIIFLLSVFITFSSSEANNGGIAVYWGQHNDDGDLSSTCDNKNYQIVIIAFIDTFGGPRPIDLNLAGHCGHGASKQCSELESDIKYCQKNNIKVFLSIGGAPQSSDPYGLASVDEAKSFANYLYNNFLIGNDGPLGRVMLDGIDFDIETTEDHWDDLARELDFLRRTKRIFFYLSAAPQCPNNPIPYLNKAIATKLFDYIFVQFYHNKDCDYSNGNAETVTNSWDKWAKLVASNNTLFLGLPASKDVDKTGYIEPSVLIDKILPHVKKTDNYGGVMLWDRHHDRDIDYSGQIGKYVVKQSFMSMSVTSDLSDSIYECVSKALHRVLPTPRLRLANN